MSQDPGGKETVRVLLFSVLQDAAGGQKEVELEIVPDTTVDDLLGELYVRWPELRKWDGQIRVGVDLEYVNRSHLIKPGQEVAVMPPVQGG